MSNLHSFLPELTSFSPYHSMGNGGCSDRQEALVSTGEDAAVASSLHSLALANSAEEFRLELAARTEALEQRFKAELETARTAWVDEVGHDLAALVGEAVAGLEQRITQSLHDVMLPFVDKLVPQAAIAAFMDVLKQALQDDFKGALCLSGPEDLITTVKNALGAQKFEIVCEPAAGVELRARSKEFTVTTRIKSWTDARHGETT